MRRTAAAIFLFLLPPFAGTGSAQDVDAAARIVLLVDSSVSMSKWANDFRAGLIALIDELPTEDEIALVSTGGQLRVRVPPTKDRQQVKAAAEGFFQDSGGNTLLDSLVEADRRLLKSVPDMWPVFVILTTDSILSRQDQNVGIYNRFMKDFVSRRGSAHAIVIAGDRTGVLTEMVRNLTTNAGGSYALISLASSLPARMREVAGLIYRDYHPKVR